MSRSATRGGARALLSIVGGTLINVLLVVLL
jgi:hypothetical protein